MVPPVLFGYFFLALFLVYSRSFSLLIHSRMYGGQLSNSDPVSSQSPRKRTTAASTNDNSSKSRTIRESPLLNCVVNSSRSPERICPISFITVNPPREFRSIRSVIRLSSCGPWGNSCSNGKVLNLGTFGLRRHAELRQLLISGILGQSRRRLGGIAIEVESTGF